MRRQGNNMYWRSEVEMKDIAPLFGEGAPDNSLGMDGKTYWDTTEGGGFYVKENGQWVLKKSVSGGGGGGGGGERKIILFTTYATSDQLEDLHYNVLSNTTGRTLSWDNDNGRFILSGTFTPNYICTIAPTYIYNTSSMGAIGKIPHIAGFIGVATEERVESIYSNTYNEDGQLTILIEIFD